MIPNAGGKVYTYQAGTSTPQTTYLDNNGTANANPIVLDAQGYCVMCVPSTPELKIIVQDSLGNTIYSIDNVSPAVTAS